MLAGQYVLPNIVMPVQRTDSSADVESKAVSSVFLKLILITFENLMCTNDIFNGVLVSVTWLEGPTVH